LLLLGRWWHRESILDDGGDATMLVVRGAEFEKAKEVLLLILKPIPKNGACFLNYVVKFMLKSISLDSYF
jgi:hypothetical protein